jgi:hypothetical protein
MSVDITLAKSIVLDMSTVTDVWTFINALGNHSTRYFGRWLKMGGVCATSRIVSL